MLKSLHFFTGLGAVLLSVILAATTTIEPSHTLVLACLGFSHLLLAPIVPAWTHPTKKNLQTLASIFLVLAVIVQIILALTHSAATPWLALAPLALGTLIHLVLQQRPSASPKQAPSTARATDSSPRAPEFSAPASSHAADDGPRETGTVKWFNTTKGFGFISRDSGEDIFIHFRAIRGEGHRILYEGQRVEYNVLEQEKGLQAEDVVVID